MHPCFVTNLTLFLIHIPTWNRILLTVQWINLQLKHRISTRNTESPLPGACGPSPLFNINSPMWISGKFLIWKYFDIPRPDHPSTKVVKNRYLIKPKVPNLKLDTQQIIQQKCVAKGSDICGSFSQESRTNVGAVSCAEDFWCAQRGPATPNPEFWQLGYLIVHEK